MKMMKAIEKMGYSEPRRFALRFRNETAKRLNAWLPVVGHHGQPAWAEA